jgi:hypothetical protein
LEIDPRYAKYERLKEQRLIAPRLHGQ